MDCAKAIGIVAAHGRSILEFQDVDTIRLPSPPLILDPYHCRSLRQMSRSL